MLGRDVAVTLGTLADPAWDYVALGHIHHHQDMNLGQYPPVVYSGSIERIDFGEENSSKGFCWVTLARGATSYEFVELPSRPFVTIKVDARAQRDPTQAVLKAIRKRDLTDAVVRVLITTSPETDALINQREIEAALSDAAFVAGILREIEYPTRARLGLERPEGLSPTELLDRYLISKDTSPERIEILKQYADLIFGEDSPGHD
jgi:exonuclease SbcD